MNRPCQPKGSDRQHNNKKNLLFSLYDDTMEQLIDRNKTNK